MRRRSLWTDAPGAIPSRSLFFGALLSGALLFGACGGELADPGLDQPIRIDHAQLFEGPLPGSASGSDGPGPHVTEFSMRNPVVHPGAANKSLSGRVSSDAVAVALSVAELGAAHWVLPVGSEDLLHPGELTWSATASFSRSLPAGLHRLRAVAIDGEGRAGRQVETSVCFASRIPDNLNACDPKSAPPEAVIVLEWDTDADLDLEIETPSGRRVNPKRPSVVAPPESGPLPANTALIRRDSLLACVPDGLRQEELVFPVAPESGTWLLRAHLFDGCGVSSLGFVMRVFVAEGQGEERRLVEQWRRAGRIVPRTDAGQDLYVGHFTF